MDPFSTMKKHKYIGPRTVYSYKGIITDIGSVAAGDGIPPAPRTIPRRLESHHKLSFHIRSVAI